MIPTALVLGAGVTLLLSSLRAFTRPPLEARVRPYVQGVATGPSRRTAILSGESLRDVLGPVAEVVGERVASSLGASEPLRVRLERVHASDDPSAFRVRQLGAATAVAVVGAVVALAGRLPVAVGGLTAFGAPALVFLVIEQRATWAASAWQRRLALELPVVAEQLAMLLGAGYSVFAAMQRLSTRGDGCCARDLDRVCRRVRQGLGERDALREWAAIAQVEGVERLVAVLAMDGEAADVGALLAVEARAIRRDGHRRLAETVERRGQQVWVPVTLATLVPGVVFLGVPFVGALRMFASS